MCPRDRLDMKLALWSAGHCVGAAKRIILDLALTLTWPPSCPELLCISKGCLFFKSYSNTTSWRPKPSSLELVHRLFAFLGSLDLSAPSGLFFTDLCVKSVFLPDQWFSKWLSQPKDILITRDPNPDLLNWKLWWVGPGNPCFNRLSGDWHRIKFENHRAYTGVN